MPETLTAEQILGIDDSPSPEVSSESAEVSTQESQVETPQGTQPAQATEETQTQTREDQTPEQPEQPEQAQLDKPLTAEQIQSAERLEQLFPKGIEQARELYALAQDATKADAAFRSGDLVGQHEAYHSILGNDKDLIRDTGWSFFQYAQTYAPEGIAELKQMIVAEALSELGATDGIRLINECLRAGDVQTAVSVASQLGSVLNQRYGTGESEQAGGLGALLARHIDPAIAKAFGPKFASLDERTQKSLMGEAQAALSQLLVKDSGFLEAVKKPNKNYGEAISRFHRGMKPKIFQLLPEAMKGILSKHASTLRNTKSMAEYIAEKAPIRKIMREVLGGPDESKHLEAGSDAVNRMSYEQILNFEGVGKRRTPYVRGSELDD